MSKHIDDKQISDVVLSLYQHTYDELEEKDFQGWAIRQLENLVQFNSLLWCDGIIHDTGPVIHNIYLHNLPTEMTEHYHRAHEEELCIDKIAVALYQNPGATLCWRDVSGTDESLWNDPLYTHFASYYDQEHICSTSMFLPNSRLASFISLFRNDRNRPFTEFDKKIKCVLTPHLVEAYRLHLQFQIFNIESNSASKSIALIDEFGSIRLESDGFGASINNLKNDSYHDSRISSKSLLKIIKSQSDQYLNKTRIASRLLPGGLYLVTVQNDPLLDHFTPREIEVFILFQQGNTYKDIAKYLDISANTVNNHLRNIRSKLDVG